MFEYLLVFIIATVALIIWMPTEKSKREDKIIYLLLLAVWVYSIVRLAFL